jgi:hypothetical protein
LSLGFTACTEQQNSYTVTSTDDEWGEKTHSKENEAEISTWQAEEKRDTK